METRAKMDATMKTLTIFSDKPSALSKEFKSLVFDSKVRDGVPDILSYCESKKRSMDLDEHKRFVAELDRTIYEQLHRFCFLTFNKLMNFLL